MELKQDFEEKLQNNKQAWDIFQNLAPSYRKQSIHWVMSAKKEETQLKRLNKLIESCENGQLIPPLRYGKKG